MFRPQLWSFNLGRYDLNLIKKHSVAKIAEEGNVKVAAKQGKTMFRSTEFPISGHHELSRAKHHLCQMGADVRNRTREILASIRVARHSREVGLPGIAAAAAVYWSFITFSKSHAKWFSKLKMHRSFRRKSTRSASESCTKEKWEPLRTGCAMTTIWTSGLSSTP